MMFFVMAQIGGLYSFFKMILGSIINVVQYKMMLIDTINYFNHRRIIKSNKRKKVELLKHSLHPRSTISSSQNKESRSKHKSLMNLRVSPELKEAEKSPNIKSEEATKYSYSEIPYQLFYSLKCWFKSSESNDSNNKESAFVNDLDKFYRHIDFVEMSLDIKEIKYMINDLYREMEKFSLHEKQQYLQQNDDIECQINNWSGIEQRSSLVDGQKEKMIIENQLSSDNLPIKDFKLVRLLSIC